MNIINIEHISKLFGDKLIFDDASFGLQEGDKVGIVGINGTGKSTLLRMVAGEETPDSGQIIRQNNLKMAYLPQTPEFPKDATVLSYAISGDEEDWQVQSNLVQLGITEYDAKLDTLSGGQRRKVALAKVLASDFDVLILDEPTNHLDNAMLSWLEDYLKNYRGTVFMVIHDRYFLDIVSNRILEISHGKMYSYDSNYSRFLELKAEREEMELASERKRQSILRMELEWAKRGCRARSTKQRARLERLEVLKNGTAPTADAVVEMDAVETRMGKKTIEFHNVSKAFGDKMLMKDFEYIFLRNQSVGIIGPNGCGKSTMLRMITGEVLPDAGTIEIGDTIRIGYLAQEEPDMDTNQRVIDYVKDIAEYVQTRDGRISASQMLERFLFTPDMQYTPISKLSGGEKRRLYLLSVLVSGANVLILDEPSNNVDIPTLTVLEDFLNTFVGIVITVSHDRYFLDRVCSEIIEIDNRQLYQYKGNYSYYLEKRQELIEAKSVEIERANNLYRTELDWMRRMPQARGHKARYREEAFYELEKVAKQRLRNDNVKLEVKASYIGSKIFEAGHLFKSFGNLKILDDFSYIFSRYEKMGIVGNNGTGKSTFIKILMGQVQPDSCTVDIGETVRFGYYSQDGLQFDEQMKVIDVIQDIAEVIELGNGKKLTASQFLQHFLFTPETQHSYVYKLSGGERRRLYLCTVLMRNPNFLVLDEPTNDLDIITLNVLEEYLQNFKGCVIVVSHDRYFMDKVVDHLMVFNGQGDIRDFPGNYSDYRDWKEAKAQKEKEAEKPQEEKTARVRLNDKRKMSFKEKREFEQLEKDIAELESEKAQIEELLCSGTLSVDELTEKSKRLPEVNDLIDEKTMRWLELSEIES